MADRVIHPLQLKVGDALPFNARDARGVLLLRQGQVITSLGQIERLVENVKSAESDGPVEIPRDRPLSKVSPLGLALEARRRLHALLSNPEPVDFTDEVRRIGSMLCKACSMNADVVLASILLCRDEPYSVRHAVNVAVSSYITGKAMHLDASTLTSIVSAALTMNIGMFDLQQQLVSLKGTLNDELRQQVEIHCEHGTGLLQEYGVNDPLWLEIVRDHHERPNGSGYPAHKSAASIAVPTQLVALGDIYCARVSGRMYRSAMAPNEALRRLFLDEGAVADEQYAALFIKTLGVYPPGTSVRLRNGSIGVVTHRGVSGQRPRVSSITTQDGLLVSTPIRRSVESEAHAVSEVVNLDELDLSISPAALWGGDALL
ncbi:phosphohydrolase [Rhodanobacter sp. AS-Z3]|uniref:HD-GYP domain-containing protein n=1 Tax=Rhodanobacter sp. AS-Z3 TaxID=3031330 RepID=UPI002479ADF8|nr:HD domain-containing phosphohydrolase [Rhodanobacter sp. AS-Z3]WEN13432.1 phosphohydrolase [Rhodanobacter sp. AS-Z3]